MTGLGVCIVVQLTLTPVVRGTAMQRFRNWIAKQIRTSRVFITLTMGVMILALVASPLAPQKTNPSPSIPGAVRIDESTVNGQPGFFRVGQSTTGRWWLIDPDNQPFLFKGVSSVNRSGLFGGQTPGPYTEVVEAKYGQDSAAFRETTLQRLRNWQFNALGAWTTEEFWDRGMPYTINLDFLKVGPRIRANGVRLPDVFDGEWARAIDAKAKTLVAAQQHSKLLVGYFTDNELAWNQGNRSDRPLDSTVPLASDTQPSLLQKCLSLSRGRAAYLAAWNFVLQRHQNSLAQLSRDWHVEVDSRNRVKQWTSEKRALVSQGYLADHRAFSQAFAQRYFQLTAEAIHRYDRNHLILGCRFGAPPGTAVLAATKRPWVDVVSANNYRYAMYDRIDIYYKATHLPVLIGEFSWGHRRFAERPLPDEPAGGLAPVQRMVQNGEQSLKRALTHPGIVGYTWYRWVDLPEGMPPISLGLVSIEDEPNLAHTEVLTRLNERAEEIAIRGRY